jgi:hypothetical protein
MSENQNPRADRIPKSAYVCLANFPRLTAHTLSQFARSGHAGSGRAAPTAKIVRRPHAPAALDFRMEFWLAE